jgi:hypothetical protein
LCHLAVVVGFEIGATSDGTSVITDRQSAVMGRWPVSATGKTAIEAGRAFRVRACPVAAARALDITHDAFPALAFACAGSA